MVMRMSEIKDLTANDIDTIINDIDSEFFSFEYAPIISKTQRHSIFSLMNIVAENIQDIFCLYRDDFVSFNFENVDYFTLEEYIKNLSPNSILFSFDLDGFQCEMDFSVEVYKSLLGIKEIKKEDMKNVDFKLCFDFVVKPILSEIVKRFNLKSTTQLSIKNSKLIDSNDILFPEKRCIYMEFSLNAENKKNSVSVVFPFDAFEKLVRFGVFAHPRRPLQNPFKYNANVVLDRIYLDPNTTLEVGSIIETTKKADDPVEILKDGKKIADGKLVAVREMFGVKKIL